MFDYVLARKAIDRIVEAFSPKMIIVFGSVARHEATDDSDLDVLVVMDTDLKGAERASAVYTAVGGKYVPMDIIVLTPEEFESTKDNPYTFTNLITTTGEIAYEARRHERGHRQGIH